MSLPHTGQLTEPSAQVESNILPFPLSREVVRAAGELDYLGVRLFKQVDAEISRLEGRDPIGTQCLAVIHKGLEKMVSPEFPDKLPIEIRSRRNKVEIETSTVYVEVGGKVCRLSVREGNDQTISLNVYEATPDSMKKIGRVDAFAEEKFLGSIVMSNKTVKKDHAPYFGLRDYDSSMQLKSKQVTEEASVESVEDAKTPKALLSPTAVVGAERIRKVEAGGLLKRLNEGHKKTLFTVADILDKNFTEFRFGGVNEELRTQLIELLAETIKHPEQAAQFGKEDQGKTKKETIIAREKYQIEITELLLANGVLLSIYGQPKKDDTSPELVLSFNLSENTMRIIRASHLVSAL